MGRGFRLATIFVLLASASVSAQSPSYELKTPTVTPAEKTKAPEVLYSEPPPRREDNTRWIIAAGVALVILSVLRMAKENRQSPPDNGNEE